MTLADFEPGKRYLVKEMPVTYPDRITETICIEISQKAVKLKYVSNWEVWHDEQVIKPWRLVEVLETLKKGEK